MKPREMMEIIERKRYDTGTAALIAGDDHWDGHNFERSGRNTFLYATPKGSYFITRLTCWQGERDTIEPMTLDEAIKEYERLTEKRCDFETAFPGVEVQEA